MKRSVFLMVLCATANAALAQTTSDDLIQLIRNNDLAALKSRLAGGASVESRDGRETTLLMYAAGYGSVDAVKLLLASGASATAKNQFNNTALLYAAGNLEKTRLLIDKGADVNAKTKSGRTPLMVAAACPGCSPIVKLLLAKGADPKAVADRGVTAIMDAAATGDAESVRLLIEAGADAKAGDKAGNDPLQLAAAGCDKGTIRLLLSKGADVNSANVFGGEVKFGKIQLIGLTPLMLASTFCSQEIVGVLLDAGAKVNVTDVRGMTPLMFAVSSEQQDAAVVNLLVRHGADVNAKSKTGETALDWSGKFGSKPVMAALTQAGAKAGIAYHPPAPQPHDGLDSRAAVEKAAGLLQRAAGEFFQQSGCVGCHHQPQALMATSAARAAGAKVSDEPGRGFVKMIEGMSRQFQQTLTERLDSGGLFDPYITLLNALAEEGYKPNTITDCDVTYLASYQSADGSWWSGGISRSPMEEGHIARTAESLRALQVYGTPGLKAEFEVRIARARNYLLTARARTNDDAAMQIAGLHWAGASKAKIHQLAQALVAAQHSDGGWGSNPNLASDAYATGEALWALNLAGELTVADAAYKKGAQYLLSTQSGDGSWYVRSRAPKFQPYFQSGFPYDHDQWISTTATAWAVRALAPTLKN